MQSLTIRPIQILSCLAVATVCIFTFPVLAQEQFVIRAMGSHFNSNSEYVPSISKSQLKRYSEVLQLGETQSLIAEELLQDYLNNFNAQAEATRNKLEEIREEVQATGNWQSYGNKSAEILNQWGWSSDKLEEKLISELRNLLYEKQQELWPVFEREKRRHDSMPNARLSGEDIDLFTLVTEVTGTEEQSEGIKEILNQYALELDIALKSRDQALEFLRKDWDEAMGIRDELKKVWERATKKRGAVRDVNDRFRQILASELGDEIGVTLNDLYMTKAFPLAFEETKADLLLGAVYEHGELTEEQETTIKGIEESYKQRFSPISTKLITEIRKEENELPPFIQHMQTRGNSRRGGPMRISVVTTGSNNEQYDGLLTERFELAKSVVKSIEATLTEEQREKLPKIDMADSNHAFFRGLRFNL